MPFVSKQQQKWGNSPAGIKALGSKDKVDEWNASTTEADLPERVKSLSTVAKAHGKKDKPKAIGKGAIASRFK
jgi:hypothetical protein